MGILNCTSGYKFRTKCVFWQNFRKVHVPVIHDELQPRLLRQQGGWRTVTAPQEKMTKINIIPGKDNRRKVNGNTSHGWASHGWAYWTPDRMQCHIVCGIESVWCTVNRAFGHFTRVTSRCHCHPALLSGQCFYLSLLNFPCQDFKTFWKVLRKVWISARSCMGSCILNPQSEPMIWSMELWGPSNFLSSVRTYRTQDRKRGALLKDLPSSQTVS